MIDLLRRWWQGVKCRRAGYPFLAPRLFEPVEYVRYPDYPCPECGAAMQGHCDDYKEHLYFYCPDHPEHGGPDKWWSQEQFTEFKIALIQGEIRVEE